LVIKSKFLPLDNMLGETLHRIRERCRNS